MLELFCANLLYRLSFIPADKRHLALNVPLGEFGFSTDSPTRLKQHHNHLSSNWVMNVHEAVANVLYKDRALKQRFSMQSNVIYLAWHPAQCKLAEIILMRLGQGFVVTGGGFSHYPAGRSNTRNKVSSQLWQLFDLLPSSLSISAVTVT